MAKENNENKVVVPGIYNAQENTNNHTKTFASSHESDVRNPGNKAASVAKSSGLDAANAGIEGANFTAVKGETGYRSDVPLNKTQKEGIDQISNTMGNKSNLMGEIKENRKEYENQKNAQAAKEGSAYQHQSNNLKPSEIKNNNSTSKNEVPKNEKPKETNDLPYENKVVVQGIYDAQENTAKHTKTFASSHESDVRNPGNKAASVAKSSGLDAANAGIEGANFTAVKGETGYRSDVRLDDKQQKGIDQISNTIGNKSNLMGEIKENRKEYENQKIAQAAKEGSAYQHQSNNLKPSEISEKTSQPVPIAPQPRNKELEGKRVVAGEKANAERAVTIEKERRPFTQADHEAIIAKAAQDERENKARASIARAEAVRRIPIIKALSRKTVESIKESNNDKSKMVKGGFTIEGRQEQISIPKEESLGKNQNSAPRQEGPAQISPSNQKEEIVLSREKKQAELNALEVLMSKKATTSKEAMAQKEAIEKYTKNLTKEDLSIKSNNGKDGKNILEIITTPSISDTYGAKKEALEKIFKLADNNKDASGQDIFSRSSLEGALKNAQEDRKTEEMRNKNKLKNIVDKVKDAVTVRLGYEPTYRGEITVDTADKAKSAIEAFKKRASVEVYSGSPGPMPTPGHALKTPTQQSAR